MHNQGIDTKSSPFYPWQVPKQIPRQSGRKKLLLTSDEHYFHKNIIEYQKRPFNSISEMNEVLINNHNSLVKKEDTIIHIGDFCFGKPDDFESIVSRLNGTHYIMDGSHDKSLRAFFETRPSSPLITSGKVSLLPKLFEFTFNGEKIILCHYAMKKWWASHHGSFHFYGHSHGNDLEPLQNSRDIGVDTTNFFPVLIEDAIESVRRNSEINEDFEQK